MFRVIKNKGKIVKAYRLGEESPAINQLIAEGKIVSLENGKYEVFSQEALKGGSGHGELASAGDYVKVDSTGAPYPNDALYFKENHRQISGDEYEQIPKILAAWNAREPMCREIEFLIREKELVLDTEHPEQYYRASLWGTTEVADINAVLIFYSISYREDGTVEDASFNLVEGKEFERTYELVK